MSNKTREKKERRFSLTQEERMKIQNMQSVKGILLLELDAMNNSIMLEVMKARSRLNVNDQAPEGYVRSVDFDYDKLEIIVTDDVLLSKDEVVQDAIKSN